MKNNNPDEENKAIIGLWLQGDKNYKEIALDLKIPKSRVKLALDMFLLNYAKENKTATPLIKHEPIIVEDNRIYCKTLDVLFTPSNIRDMTIAEVKGMSPNKYLEVIQELYG